MAIGSRRYEQLIEDLKADYRPQREWIERQGLYLIVGHFLSGIAAGTWFFSLIFDLPAGLLVAFALAALSGLFHLAFLGRPERFWKMWRARNSWIARGFIGLTLFLVGGLIHLATLFSVGAPWGGDSAIAQGGYFLALMGTVLLLLYKGFVYASSKGVPFWTSPILPALYVAYALRGGIATLLLVLLTMGDKLDPWNLGVLELWIGITAAVMILFYLSVMSTSNTVARRSVHELIGGRVALSFYLGTLAVGLLVPIGIGLAGLTTSLSLAAIATIGVASVIGDFFVKYTIAKAGIYIPLYVRSAPRSVQSL